MEHEINHIPGLSGFLNKWNAESPTISPDKPVALSIDQFIIVKGHPVYSRPIFTQGSSLFWDSIEPGIRELVWVLVCRHKLVTYSSCQGHYYAEPGIFLNREVGIVCRDKEEERRVFVLLEEAARSCNNIVKETGITIPIKVLPITSEGKTYTAVDVVFQKGSILPEEYFQRIESVYNYFVGILGANHGVSKSLLNEVK